ncbi:hypothetical protein ES708_15977 [subsurface metagenome]
MFGTCTSKSRMECLISFKFWLTAFIDSLSSVVFCLAVSASFILPSLKKLPTFFEIVLISACLSSRSFWVALRLSSSSRIFPMIFLASKFFMASRSTIFCLFSRINLRLSIIKRILILKLFIDLQ